MRRRAGGAVRVLAACARCGATPDNYHVRRVTTHVGTQRYELVECRSCEAHYAGEPTRMERDALAIAPDDRIGAMEFFQVWRADVVRVQHTARVFLGAERCAALAAELRPARDAEKEESEAWREHTRARIAAELTGILAEEEDDDLPY